MAQQSPSPVALSSPNPSFVPRKEFIREHKPTLNLFAVLAIATSNAVRLYSFPPSVVVALRSLFQSRASLTDFHEDVHQNFCEFVLDGKPWASPKSVRAETLLIDILASLYLCGYTFLSTVDYGRESDDRLTIAFSKAATTPPPSDAHSATPLHPPFHGGSTASITSDVPKARRVPFALSFLSPTLMRVVSPPLHLTPAILQAVRASWPRGVVSEKKVGDNSFEFKLKGYKWFQQDTFATDSLRHMFALLSSLDGHAFTLLSSISLTSRSRAKDLWVFTGQSLDFTDEFTRRDSMPPTVIDDSSLDRQRAHHLATRSICESESLPTFAPYHRKFATEPGVKPLNSAGLYHAKATSDQGNQHAQNGHRHLHGQSRPIVAYPSPISTSPALLRKPAPRAQVPVSVVHHTDPPLIGGLRVNLPSTVSSGVEDMTGIGTTDFTPDVFYAIPPSRNTDARLKASEHAPPPPITPPPNPQPQSPLPSSSTSFTATSPEEPAHLVPGLLGIDAFRDSALSSTTDASYEVPIKWTGKGEMTVEAENRDTRQSDIPYHDASFQRLPVGLTLPHSWQLPPIAEKGQGASTEKPESSISPEQQRLASTPVQEVRVASPELTRPEMPLRKSEAAVVGLISESSPPPTITRSNGPDSLGSGSGQGWVLVNVEHGITSTPQTETLDKCSDSPSEPSSLGLMQPTPNPHAKAIVVIDALDSKAKAKEKPDSTQTKKRLFSLRRNGSRKNSQQSTQEPRQSTVSPRPRPGFRERLKLIGIPEAARNNTQRSID